MDPYTLVVAPQVGGRIMGKMWHGRELAFVDNALAGQIQNPAAIADIHTHKREHDFPLWGGDKTWLAPQQRWTDGVPFLDLDVRRTAPIASLQPLEHRFRS